MKFSYQWISELVDGLNIEPEELKRLITLKTAECEGIEPFGAHFARVQVVKALSVHPAPSGKNKVVEIEAAAGARHQVICGAPNVREGMLAVWVPPGTVLNGKTIGIAVIDGVESEGMLASRAELDLGRDASGLLELYSGTPGDSLGGVRPDWIIEIDNKSLTHRPDLWGHLGMAREIAAISGRPLVDPVSPLPPADGPCPIQVSIEDTARCSRYSALVIENVSVAGSPLALTARLESVGLNAISNIVDVTNYVLVELPQPMHAFDADKISGGTIFVRQARTGERLSALNGETYNLHPDDLVIADGSGPIALAGVIGGADSAISSTTTRIILESANFNATAVRLTSARHKLRTDASVRFEKSLDPENTVRGLARAAALILQVCPGAQVRGQIADCYTPLPPVAPILLPVDYVSRKLGKSLNVEEIERILNALGFATAPAAPGVLTVSVPSWRATKDISMKADLVEEIGRMIGYGNIPPRPPEVACVVPPANRWNLFLRSVRRLMAAQGFSEIYSYSFVDETQLKRWGYEPQSAIKIANPIASNFSHLRPTLLPGLFAGVLTNVRHFQEFRLFEIGSEIHKSSQSAQPDQVTHLAAALYSAHSDEGDFFEMKRVVECLLPGSQTHSAEPRSYEHPARAASITWQGAAVGRLFEVHPAILEKEGIEGRARAVFFDLNLSQVLPLRESRQVRYTVPRRYPTSPFDLSVVTGLRTPVAEIQDNLVRLAKTDLAAIDFVRQYDGPPLPQGQKSVTYHLEIGSLRHTVTTEEVTAVRNRITEGMRKLGFEFRE